MLHYLDKCWLVKTGHERKHEISVDIRSWPWGLNKALKYAPSINNLNENLLICLSPPAAAPAGRRSFCSPPAAAPAGGSEFFLPPLLLRPLGGNFLFPFLLLLRPLGDFLFLPCCCGRWGGGAFCRLFIHESDRILVSACMGCPQVWCEIYGMQKSGPFSFCRYGKDTCSIVALRWCSANQYYYNIWRRQIDHRYTYTEADLTGLPRDADWTEFLASLPATGAMRTRAKGPDALRPRQPVSSP